MTDAVATPDAGTPGPADLVEIFYAPSSVFARRQGGQWGLPYLALVVLGVGLFFATRSLIQPAMDADIARGMALAAARAGTTVDQMPGAGMARTIGSAGVVLYFVVGPFVIALLVWLVGLIARVPRIGATALAIAVFSAFPRLVSTVVGAVEGALLPDTSLTSTAALSISPARFINPATSPGLSALMLRFDLFGLWGVVLIAIGVRSAAGGTWRQAWITAVGVWFVATLPAIWALSRG